VLSRNDLRALGRRRPAVVRGCLLGAVVRGGPARCGQLRGLCRRGPGAGGALSLWRIAFGAYRGASVSRRDDVRASVQWLPVGPRLIAIVPRAAPAARPATGSAPGARGRCP